MKNNYNKIKRLFTFLDDDDENTVYMAMAEILHYERDIEKILSDMQESPDEKIRRRIHQLQSVIKLRRHRHLLSQTLTKRRINIVKALFELQLLWYDLDNMEHLMEIWNAFLANSCKYGPSTLERLAYFMRKKGFDVSDNALLECDDYCLGSVLEELSGADFLLCIIAFIVAEKHGLHVKIVKYGDDFGVYEKGKLLLPKKQWKIINVRLKDIKRVRPLSIIKLTALHLFFCALTTQSFRYIYTIGSLLGELEKVKTEDFFPFPYNPAVPVIK